MKVSMCGRVGLWYVPLLGYGTKDLALMMAVHA